MKKYLLVTILRIFLLLSYGCAFAQIVEPLDCNQVTSFQTLADRVGMKGFIIEDLDNDGNIEILASGSPYLYVGAGHENLFFTILQYSNEKPFYKYIVSSSYFEEKIINIKTFDSNNDGEVEIFVLFSDGQVKVFNFKINKLIHINTIKPIDAVYTYNMDMADVDNDGTIDLLLHGYKNILLYDPITLKFKHKITHDYFLSNLSFGQVDNDPYIEIISDRGYIFQYANAQLITEVFSAPFSAEWIRVADTNNDDVDEILYLKNDRLSVYNTITRSNIYSIEEASTAAQLVDIYDYNDDGAMDIVRFSQDSVKIYNGMNKNIMFQYKHSDKLGYNLPSNFSIIDIDGDGVLEIIWAFGYDTTIIDRIVSLDSQTKNIDWITDAITDHFSFDAFDFVDMNGDAILDIIYYNDHYDTIHLFPFQYSKNYLLALDGKTKQVIKRSSKYSTFASLNIWDIEDLKIGNIDDNPDLEIVLLATESLIPKIYIFDLQTFELEKVYSYSEKFKTVHITDINKDNKNELVLSSAKRVWIVNGNTGEVMWNSGSMSSSYFRERAGYNFEVLDVNADGEKDIIVLLDSLFVFKGPSFSRHYVPLNSTSTSLAVANLDQDNALEMIVYERTTHLIKIIDGQTLLQEKTILFKVENNYYDIDGMRILDENNNGIPEFLIFREGRYYIFEDPKRVFESKRLGDKLNLENRAKIRKINPASTQKSLFCNTTYGFLEINLNCLGCLWFDTKRSLERELTCLGIPDGQAAATTINGTYPFSYLWQDASNDSLRVDLSVDTYRLTITDAIGCVAKDTFNIRQASIQGAVKSTPNSCRPQFDGKAWFQITKGLSPYIYNWSNNFRGDTLTNVPSGLYYLTITDANHCKLMDSVKIIQSLLITDALEVKQECNENKDGKAQVNIINGTAPYVFTWNNGAVVQNPNNLSKGQYIVTVSDFQHCVFVDTVSITQRILKANLNPTNVTCFGAKNGEIGAEIISGTPPFLYQWNNGKTSNKIDALKAGIYSVSIKDSLKVCEITEVVTLSEPTQIRIAVQTAPDNPATQVGEGNAKLTVTGGTPPYQYFWNNGGNSDFVTELVSGTYKLTVTDANSCKKDTIVVISISTASNNGFDDEVLSIYPNPTSNFLEIDLGDLHNNQAKYYLKVRDLLGREQKMTSIQNYNQKIRLDVSDFAAGFFTIELNLNNKKYKAKFLVIK